MKLDRCGSWNDAKIIKKLLKYCRNTWDSINFQISLYLQFTFAFKLINYLIHFIETFLPKCGDKLNLRWNNISVNRKSLKNLIWHFVLECSLSKRNVWSSSSHFRCNCILFTYVWYGINIHKRPENNLISSEQFSQIFWTYFIWVSPNNLKM